VTARDGGGVVRRSLAALAGLVVVFASHAPVAAAEPLRLTVGTVGSIGALDPRAGTSDVAQEVWNLQYPTLTALDPKTLDPAPGLAIAWSPAPNGRGWVYTLRPRAAWSDGKPVTAADVVASVERAGGSARALGDREIEIADAVPGELVNVAPQHVLERVPDLDKNLQALGVGAGPWHVTARTDDSVQLDARTAAPALRQIVFRTYPSADSLLSALHRGEVDVVSGLPYADAERLGALPGVTVDHAPDGTQFVLENSLSDARARRAISLAIDRTDLVAKTVDGIGTPGVVPIRAQGSVYAPDDGAQQRLEASLDAQPERARRLLTDAVLPDRPLRFAVARDTASRRVAEYIVGALDAVGVHTEIVDDGDEPYDLRLVRSSTTGDSRDVGPTRPEPPVNYPDRVAQARATTERVTESGRLVGLFQPDTLQAFRSDNVTGWLRTPQIRSLVVFAPTTMQYSQLLAAPPPPGEEASTSTYVVGAIGVLAVCAIAFAVAAWIRRRSIA
jgi:peptide/nickel transport system substrate-binding protein